MTIETSLKNMSDDDIKETWYLTFLGGATLTCPELIKLYIETKDRAGWNIDNAKVFASLKEAEEFKREHKLAMFIPEGYLND